MKIYCFEYMDGRHIQEQKYFLSLDKALDYFHNYVMDYDGVDSLNDLDTAIDYTRRVGMPAYWHYGVDIDIYIYECNTED